MEKRIKKDMIICSIIFILLILDEITTYIGLKNPLISELNPIYKYNYFLNFSIKFIFFIGILIMSIKMKFKENILQLIKSGALISYMMYYLWVVFNNLFVIITLR